MAIEDVTRNDLEQLFEDHTTTMLKEFEKVYDELGNASDERAKIRTSLDRLDKRTNEDVVSIVKDFKKLQLRVEVLEKQRA